MAPNAGFGRAGNAVLGGGFLLVLFSILTFVSARLSALFGVYAAEDVGVVDGIKRAWALSKGSVATIVLLALFVGAVTLAIALMQYVLDRAGPMTGIGGFIGGLASAAAGALLFIYQAAGLGYLYRRLAAADAG